MATEARKTEAGATMVEMRAEMRAEMTAEVMAGMMAEMMAETMAEMMVEIGAKMTVLRERTKKSKT